jgi:hypothetical protein
MANPVSFIEVLQALGNQIIGDASLQAYCQAKWGRNLKARISYRPRTEIHLGELPVLLITRPRVAKRRDAPGGPIATNAVRLYLGFYQPDQEKVVGEQIGLEEMVEDAILRDTSLGDVADEVSLGDSANDEGSKHPSCFTVMELEVAFQRQPVSAGDGSTIDDFLHMHADYDLAVPDGQVDATDDINPQS